MTKINFFEGSYMFKSETTDLQVGEGYLEFQLANQYEYRPTTEILWCEVIEPITTTRYMFEYGKGLFKTIIDQNNQKMNTRYFSFVGMFHIPNNKILSSLRKKYTFATREEYVGTSNDGEDVYRDFETGFCEELAYELCDVIGGDGIDIYIAKIEPGLGHMVVECVAGDWRGNEFVLLDKQDKPILAKNNINPNPIPQIKIR